MYYHHDLENRSSYILKVSDVEFINYDNDNMNVNKDLIFGDIKKVSNLLLEIYLDEFISNKEFKEFFIFLFYLDKENFVDFLTFLLIANYELKQDDVYFDFILRNKTLQKEFKIFRDSMGLSY